MSTPVAFVSSWGEFLKWVKLIKTEVLTYFITLSLWLACRKNCGVLNTNAYQVRGWPGKTTCGEGSALWVHSFYEWICFQIGKRIFVEFNTFCKTLPARLSVDGKIYQRVQTNSIQIIWIDKFHWTQCTFLCN